MAVANYHDAYGSLPPAYITDESGRPMHSWRVLLLPFIDRHELYDQYDFNEPWDGPNNRKLLHQRPKVFAFSDRESQSETMTNYLVVVGEKTVWPGSECVQRDQVTDGAFSTILIVENDGSGIHWMEPRDLRFESMEMSLKADSAIGVSSKFQPPAIVTLGGSVQTLSMDLEPSTLRAMLTSNGREVIQDDRVQEISDGRLRPAKDE